MKGGCVYGMNILFLLKPKQEVAHLVSDCTVRQALEKMRSSGYTAIPIINREGEYIATVTEGDFLWLVLGCGTDILKKTEHMPLESVKLRTVNKAVSVNAKLEDLLLMTMNQNFVPVVDDRNIFIGIITRRDVLQYFYNKLQNEKTAEKKISQQA